MTDNIIFDPICCDQCPCYRNKYSFIWISDPLQTIYLENPKVASTSITTALGIKGENKNNPYQFKVVRSFRTTPLQLPDYFVFGFCRNPWDRMISIWKSFTTSKNKMQLLRRYWRIAEPKELSFDDFIHRLTDGRCNHNHHWQAQSIFIPIDRIKIDYLGRFESISESWNRLCQLLNIKVNLDHLRSTEHNHYSTYYNDTTQKIVEKLYEKDIKIFKYNYESSE